MKYTEVKTANAVKLSEIVDKNELLICDVINWEYESDCALSAGFGTSAGN